MAVEVSKRCIHGAVIAANLPLVCQLDTYTILRDSKPLMSACKINACAQIDFVMLTLGKCSHFWHCVGPKAGSLC